MSKETFINALKVIIAQALNNDGDVKITVGTTHLPFWCTRLSLGA
ncbi:hypothetical protein [Pseudoalteromonas sp. S3178]|nr:hypothetical protein [Pseudoalteromonas sp. S3178]